MKNFHQSFSRLLLILIVFFSIAGRLRAQNNVEANAPDAIVLDWKNGELTAGNSTIMRRWKLSDGLPLATSLSIGSEEWLRTSTEPTTTLPASMGLRAPFDINWKVETGRELPVEATSRRGTLSVIGSDGRGYRWHLKVFADSTSVTCRFEFLTQGTTIAKSANDAPPVVSGLEGSRAAGLLPVSRIDLLEHLLLRPENLELRVVDLADLTDQKDNLASERMWRLSPKEIVQAATNLCVVENPLTGSGLLLLKHAPLPSARPSPTTTDVVGRYQSVAVFGHGAGDAKEGYAWSVIGYTGGKWGRARALHRLQGQLKQFKPGRDGLMISNTWGDRSQDSRVTETFVLEEIKAGKAFGIDACQIDDGWQRGITSNSAVKKGGIWEGGFWANDPQFWDPRPSAFPTGLESVAAAAKAAHMGLGLWFSPDGANEYTNWNKDADAVIGFNRKWSVTKVKIDGMKILTKKAEQNFHAFVEKVLKETDGAVAFDLDITNGVRPGYFGLMEATLFVENRYSDWHNWWPHGSLRNLWQLAWYIPPQRLRMEFLNSTRNGEKYQGDPLAPANYPADYICATTLVANPLAWFEVSNLPGNVAKPMSDLVGVWKQHRAELQAGDILPVGDCPSGVAWTGFCSVGQGAVQVLIFRELTQTADAVIPLPVAGAKWTVDKIAGEGSASISTAGLHVSIPHSLHYIWVRLIPTKES